MNKIQYDDSSRTTSEKGVEFIQALKPCKNGHLALRYSKFGACIECVRENNAKNRSKNGHKYDAWNRKWRHENKVYFSAHAQRFRMKHPEQAMLRNMLGAAKRTTKRRNLPFNLESSDIEIPAVCPVLGIEIRKTLGVGKRTDNSPSLDRIIPERGYVKGNVIVVSWRANRLKQDASIEELRKIADFYQRIAQKD